MAVCDVCRQEMTGAGVAGCSEAACVRASAGIALARVPHRGPAPCDDCGVVPGALHHLLCEDERCPACDGQLLSCGCEIEGEPAYLAEHRAECRALLHDGATWH